MLVQAGVVGGLDANPMHRADGERPAGDLPGKEPFGRPRDFPIVTEQDQKPRREHHIAILASLALTNDEDHPLAIDVIDAKARDLGDP